MNKYRVEIEFPNGSYSTTVVAESAASALSIAYVVFAGNLVHEAESIFVEKVGA